MIGRCLVPDDSTVEPIEAVDVPQVTTEPTITAEPFNWSSAAELGYIPLDVPLDADIQEFIYCLSYDYSIDFPFVMAVIEHESTFKSGVISKTNDYGLMQINIGNHEWLSKTLGIADFTDPYENVRAGLYILKNLFEKYDDPTMVLMAYNMGETGASKLWNNGIYSTTYSQEILAQAELYTQEIERTVEKND